MAAGFLFYRTDHENRAAHAWTVSLVELSQNNHELISLSNSTGLKGNIDFVHQFLQSFLLGSILTETQVFAASILSVPNYWSKHISLLLRNNELTDQDWKLFTLSIVNFSFSFFLLINTSTIPRSPVPIR